MAELHWTTDSLHFSGLASVYKGGAERNTEGAGLNLYNYQKEFADAMQGKWEKGD